MLTNNGDLDQTHRSVASDLVLHCVAGFYTVRQMSHKKDARLKCVKAERKEYPQRSLPSQCLLCFSLLMSRKHCNTGFVYTERNF